MENATIGIILLEVAMALGCYRIFGTWGAVGSLIGSSIFFTFLR